MRRTLCWLLIFSLFIVVSGCGIMDWIFPEKDGDGPPDEDEYIELPGPDEEDTSSQGRIIYVADLHGKYVLPITCDIPWEEGIAKAVVRHMVEGGPAQQFLTTHGLKAVLPAGTTILGMSIRDGACIVDFSPELLHTADQVHERLLLDALTYTLTEFPTIETVSIRVSGEPLTRMPHGTLVDAVLSRERGVNSLASAKGTGAAVTIYLRMDSLAGGSLLVPVTRPVASTLDLARAALEQLLGGPGQEFGLNPVLPTTTRIEGLSVQGGVATVDFSSDLAQAEDLDVAVAAIVLTLTELSGIDSVKLTIGGEAVKLHDGRVLSEPVLRPTSTNPLSF